MKREQIYLSTLAPDAAVLAEAYGFGLEIAEFCTAWNMDERFGETDALVRGKVAGVSRRILHAPFNELFPCAIDPRARALAADRYRQAIALAKGCGADKVVIHGGYNPGMYYPVWYVEQSVLFWQTFLKDDPGVTIVLENVLEEEPGMLLDIVRGVDDPRLGLCLDVGHVNAYSKVPVLDWVKAWGPWARHFHLHNNDGGWDTHSSLGDGTIPMAELLALAAECCPEATFTLEVPEAAPSVRWLMEHAHMQ